MVRNKLAVGGAVIAALAVLGGCASMDDGRAPSRPTLGEPHTSAAAPSSHRQYFDQRRGRYYYFDQTSHRYFWEDGSPRD